MIVGRRAVLLVVGVAALAALIFLVMRVPGPPGVDDAMHRWLLAHRHKWATDVALVVTTSGSSIVLYGAAAVAVVASWFLHRRRAAMRSRWLRPVIALGVLAVGALLRTGLSDLLHRLRPPSADWISSATGWSMPSGHSTNAALAAGMVVWSLWPWLRSRRSRLWSVSVAALFAGSVGWSRAYLGVHWPTDVLAGWLFAACWATTALWIVRLVAVRGIATPPLRDSDARVEDGPDRQHFRAGRRR